jgi:hypothetical protein
MEVRHRVTSFTDSLVEQWVVINKNGPVALIDNMRSLAGLNRRVIELNACSRSHSASAMLLSWWRLRLDEGQPFYILLQTIRPELAWRLF